MDNAHEFPHLNELIYLNHAAVAPWPRRSCEAVAAFADENMRLGSMNYPKWLAVEQRLKGNLARLINAHSADDIALVKNTSEALSFVAYGLPWQAGDNIVSSDQEFPSNRIVWQSLARQGVEFREADLDAGPTPEDALLARVDPRTRLVTISSVQYASGLRMDLERIGRFCRERGILFCVDAIQSLGALRFDVQRIEADFVMADGHKWLLGPEGLGLFYCRPELRERLQLSQYGWHMVDPLGDFASRDWRPAQSGRRFECGSPNMLGIHALEASTALLLEQGMANVEGQLLANSRYLFERLKQSGKVEVLSNQDPDRYAGIVTFRPRLGDLDALFKQLTSNDIFCAQRGDGIRFSPHFYTPRAQLDEAVRAIEAYLG
jgi:selenocysteine lyase/cysteine desulfurase